MAARIKHLLDPSAQAAARAHERDDCAHYLECLGQAAQGERYSGGAQCLPCQDCPRFEPSPGEGLDAWRKRGDWNPDLG